MPYAEPNGLPEPFVSWQEWRETYSRWVTIFNDSPKGTSDELRLKLHLQRLGYDGKRLEDEIQHIKCTQVSLA